MRNLIFIFALMLVPVLVSCNNNNQNNNDTSTASSEAAQGSNANAVENGDSSSQDLKTFFLNKYGAQLPPGVDVKVSEITSSDMKGFDKGSFDVEVTGRGKQSVPFLVSDNGRYLIIGASSPVDLSGFEDSPVKGLKQGNINIGRGPVPVLLSDDGKSMLVGELLDTTVDPLKEVSDSISMENVPTKGSESAKVVVVEYSDFQCPFCKRGADMIPQILSDYKDDVKVVYKQLPLANHKWAKPASIASLCAFEQDGEKFWSFHDAVFEKQKEINIDNSGEKLKGIATDVGLDVTAYEKCIGSEEMADRVQADIKEAQSIGVSSTPTFVVDGIIVPGANLQALKNAIDSRLSQQGG